MFRVTLIGPDGCGKSAVASQLADRMPVPVRRIYMGVNLEAGNIMLPTSRLQLAIQRWRGMTPDAHGPRDPRLEPTSSANPVRRILKFIKSAIRTTHLIAEECFRLAVIRWWLFRGFIVIQDRDFFVDYFEYDVADNGATRTLSQRIHGVYLRYVYSKPDLTLLLDVDATTMLARKGEGTVARLQRRRQHYRDFINRMPAHDIVRADGCVQDVVTLCRDRILNYRQRRIADRRNEVSVRVDGPPVIVIGLDCVTGLQTARILSARGIRVIGLASRINHFCCRTNAIEQLHESATSGQDLINSLQSLGGEFGQKPVLIPCTDLSVLTISKHRQQLQSSFEFILPAHDLLEQLVDKAGFARLAEQHGFDIPTTRILKSTADAQLAAVELSFPVFLKPAVKTTVWESNTKQKAVQADSPTDMIAAWNKYSRFAETMIAQEFIPGGVQDCLTVNVFFDRHGRPHCSYVSEKCRQWPPVSGTACLARPTDNTIVVQQTLDFFTSLGGYQGLGYVEFKRDAGSDRYLIIEPNVGRPTGRSAMAEAAGTELLLKMYCEVTGIRMPVNALKSESPGRSISHWIHLRRDIQAGFRAWRHKEHSIKEWVASLSGPRVFAVANRNDPKPFLTEFRHYVAQLVLGRRQRPESKTSPIEDDRSELQCEPVPPVPSGFEGVHEVSIAGRQT